MRPFRTYPIVTWVVVVLFFIAVGAAVARWLFPAGPVVETPAAAITQTDGSVVLERKPDAKAKPKQKVPKGATVERQVSVTVKPDPIGPLGGTVAGRDCPPVTVDMTLVRMSDQTRRVVASSPNGEVLAGLDVPVESAPAPKKWAAGMSYDPMHGTPGIWVERDLARIRLGLDASLMRQKIGGPVEPEVRIRVGWTF